MGRTIISPSMGLIQSAEFCNTPSFALVPVTKTGNRARGIIYEGQAQEHLCSLSPFYLPSKWIRATSNTGVHYCQPDGILFNIRDRAITIIEIKLRHTQRAHDQLVGRYKPLLIWMFPGWAIRTVEVVRFIDKDLPVSFSWKLSPNPFTFSEQNMIGVYIWTR